MATPFSKTKSALDIECARQSFVVRGLPGAAALFGLFPN